MATKMRRSSAEIVAVTTELRHRQSARKKGKKGKSDMDDAKRELDMDEHKKSIAELCADLTTSVAGGMNTSDADTRREIDGPNKLTPPRQTPEIVKLIREMTGFFALLLWAGGILCEVCYALVGGSTNLWLGVVLFGVVVITGLFSYSQNRKSSNLMESFKNMMPTITTVVRDGKSTKIDASLLVRGDIIVLKGGDKVPADIRIVECSDDLAVDNSSLTGEPEPLKRIPDCTHENPLETKNLCFFGTFIPQGSGKGVVIRTGDRTVMGRIAKLATATKKEETPIAKEINHFVHIITAVAVCIGLIFLIIGFSMGQPPIQNIVFMIGIIVANVPEGLIATMTVCLSLAAARMARKSVLVKNLEGVETLGSTSCICSDKTGTLTQNIMTVANVVYDNQIFDAECSITPIGNYKMDNPSFQRLQRCATLCNNAVFDEDSKFEKVVTGTGKSVQIARGAPVAFSDIVTTKEGARYPRVVWETIGDASESAMIKFCQEKRDIIEYRNNNTKIKEIPFNSRNKYQLSIHKQDNDESKPMLLVMKGAPERISIRCSKIMINGQIEDMTEERRAEVEACQLSLSKKGMRVLGFAEKELDLDMYRHGYEFNTDNCNFPLGEKDVDYEVTPTPNKKIEEPLCFIGLMALIDPPRPEVPLAVAKCKSAGIKVIMVTGDHPITAKAIAHKVGILWGPTKEDIEDENKENGLVQGDPGWKNPDSAPAIVVPGWTISIDTPEEEWDRILSHRQCVFARTSPQQKLIIVENCQRRGEIVAVTGDGVNDSPALKKADIGIAMGIMGSEVSKEAADMILLDDNFASIVCGVEEGRKVFDNLKKSICYALAVNIPELIPFLTYVLIMIPCPLTTILMLLICLGTDLIPAISMAYEDAENDIMLRSPRRPSIDRLVTKKLIWTAYCHIGMIEAFAGHIVYFIVLNDYGYPAKVLPGLGNIDSFGKQVLWCKMDKGEFCSAGGYYDKNGIQTPLGSSADPVCSSMYNQTIPGSNNIMDAQVWWRAGDDGRIVDCLFPYANYIGPGGQPLGYDNFNPTTYGSYTNGNPMITVQAMEAAWNAGYVPYYPYASRRSAFFKAKFFYWDPMDGEVDGFGKDIDQSQVLLFQPIGIWSIYSTDVGSASVSTFNRAISAFDGQTAKLTDSNGTIITKTISLSSSNVYKNAYGGWMINNLDGTPVCTGQQCLLDYRAGFTYRSSNPKEPLQVNVMSRRLCMMALIHAQTAYFVGVVVMQWANILNCKTRFLSIRIQGMRNSVLLFGLGFEFFLCAATCYSSFFQMIFSTTGIRLTHWFAAMPAAMFMFTFDEMRKYMLRSTSIVYIDKATGKSERVPGWVERNSYY
ncbi:sodium/potassium-transporting ATPase subunit alpha [Thraustotheca clavata]|uniref:Sodium/potassium-transporting ATPase subunit alpha n=1 Tax=Thraustotheca clavata TaxID=74557 RepID=A0A1W0A3M9_9STRA|nr:sodium/potassium-transporting ATPase subunit alpha [Thraustotheca clavata]